MGLKRINVGDAKKLCEVGIIGTKYHPGGHDFVIKTSRVPAAEEQCLFLVADINDSSGVFLHNGKQRLGIVDSHQATFVRRFIEQETIANGHDVVLVCKTSYMSKHNEAFFKQCQSFSVSVEFVVNERLARKFSAKYLQE